MLEYAWICLDMLGDAWKCLDMLGYAWRIPWGGGGSSAYIIGSNRVISKGLHVCSSTDVYMWANMVTVQHCNTPAYVVTAQTQ